MHGLPKEAEAAMTRALDRATELVEAGDHPTTALIKAANENSLTAGHARLTAVAYNTGRAAFQREENNDITKKIAEFELADPELIAAEIGHTQKTASVVESKEVSAVYSQPPTFLREQYKRAMADIEIPNLCEKTAGPLPAARTNDALQATSDVRSLQRKVAGLREVHDEMLRDLDGQFDAMQHDLRILGAPALATLQKAAATRRDVGVTAVFNEIGRRDPLLTKAAASNSPLLSESAQKLYARAESMAQAAGDFIVANKKLAEVQSQVGAQIQAKLEPFVQKVSAVNDPFFELNAATVKHAAGMAQRLIMPFAGAAAGAHETKTQDENVRHYQMALEDPGQDQTLRGLRARTTMEQLRATDPVLSGYSQPELIHAFNQIVQSAPDAAAHPVYMQAMMRRYLGQGNELAPDDIRSNVLGPQSEMTKARLQNIPDLPESSRRPAGAGGKSPVVTTFNRILGTQTPEKPADKPRDPRQPAPQQPLTP